MHRLYEMTLGDFEDENYFNKDSVVEYFTLAETSSHNRSPDQMILVTIDTDKVTDYELLRSFELVEVTDERILRYIWSQSERVEIIAKHELMHDDVLYTILDMYASISDPYFHSYTDQTNGVLFGILKGTSTCSELPHTVPDYYYHISSDVNCIRKNNNQATYMFVDFERLKDELRMCGLSNRVTSFLGIEFIKSTVPNGVIEKEHANQLFEIIQNSTYSIRNNVSTELYAIWGETYGFGNDIPEEYRPLFYGNNDKLRYRIHSDIEFVKKKLHNSIKKNETLLYNPYWCAYVGNIQHLVEHELEQYYNKFQASSMELAQFNIAKMIQGHIYV